MFIYTVKCKKTKQVLCEGSIKEVAYVMNISQASVYEHYMDRDNKNRFVNSDYIVERRKE